MSAKLAVAPGGGGKQNNSLATRAGPAWLFPRPWTRSPALISFRTPSFSIPILRSAFASAYTRTHSWLPYELPGSRRAIVVMGGCRDSPRGARESFLFWFIHICVLFIVFCCDPPAFFRLATRLVGELKSGRGE